MPTIAWFYGIAIRMYFVDHPPPHFEAVYGEYDANIAIAIGEVLNGVCRGRRRAWSSNGPWRIRMSCARIGTAPVLSFRSNA
jgi:hypothetical protein